ncbi:MAG: TOTE conflict system archaeo-eukaryotic primase domain-containing protein [Pseudomarimonas sp.]
MAQRVRLGGHCNRILIPRSDSVICDHAAGKHTAGVYPVLKGDSCYFLAADFDEADWREDARALLPLCEELAADRPASQGSHPWPNP